jgi:hypothetical protein
MRISVSGRVYLLGTALAVITAGAAMTAGCLYDESARCGAGEVLDMADNCVCAPGNVPVYRDITVLMPVSPTEAKPFSSCKPCGANQMVRADKCVCAPGFAQGATGCVASNLGATCTADADCASGDQKFCSLPAGYCTKSGCATNADCNTDADYACATTATPPYCKRPPLGQGAACTAAQGDPACTAEAPVCAVGSCVPPPGCKVDGDCTPSRKCCDLTNVGQPGLTLCLAGACP